MLEGLPGGAENFPLSNA